MENICPYIDDCDQSDLWLCESCKEGNHEDCGGDDSVFIQEDESYSLDCDCCCRDNDFETCDYFVEKNKVLSKK